MSISHLAPIGCKPRWKKELSNLVSDPAELCKLLEISADDSETIKSACQQFPLRVPRPYLSRIKKGDMQDPLLLQVLPQASELLELAGFSADPLDEAVFTPIPGLLHKYYGRVLVVLNGNCAIHCRYCFRRHFPYQEHRIGRNQWQQILDYVNADPSIDEVILSGGDPLTCNDTVLAKKIADLQDIKHLARVRLHTRVPIMIPARINSACLNWMRNSRLKIVTVIHSNHAQEIDREVAQALTAMARAGVTLLNQTVLLKHVNDSAAVLSELSKRLFDIGVLPYYLHMLDPVQGAAHFQVNVQQAHAIRDELQAILPGYLVPKLVVELPFKDHKTLL